MKISNRLKAKLKSFLSFSKSFSLIFSLATKIYFPVLMLFSKDKTKARNLRRALFRWTALPIFLDVTKANFSSSSGLKKATNESVCHF